MIKKKKIEIIIIAKVVKKSQRSIMKQIEKVLKKKQIIDIENCLKNKKS